MKGIEKDKKNRVVLVDRLGKHREKIEKARQALRNNPPEWLSDADRLPLYNEKNYLGAVLAISLDYLINSIEDGRIYQ